VNARRSFFDRVSSFYNLDGVAQTMSSAPNGHSSRSVASPSVASFADRLPPQNIEAEMGVLGGVLLNNDMLHEVMTILTADDFYREAHQTIFRAIRDLYDQGKGVDAIILADELVRRGEFERVGGEEILAAVLNSVPHAANAKYHAHIVRQKSISRHLIQSCNESLQEIYDGKLTADEQLESAERRIFQIAEEQVTGETVELRDILGKTMDRIAARSESRHAVTGVGTGYYELDDMSGGLQNAQLIILAARPSMGKTAIALNICEHVAVNLRKGVLVVSLEMVQNELAERLICARSRIDGQKLKTGQNLSTRDMAQLGKGFEELRSSPIFIDDTPTRTMLQITANARRLKMRHDIGLVIVDYIQLIESESEDGRDNRQEQIAKISRRLKTLARELEVPVIALSQLNRAVETREDRRPRMADLRESGAIEQDADLVLLLHRPEYYDPNDQPGLAELIIAKNRNGATGKIKLAFLKTFFRFENLATVAEPIDAGSF
jgi:replicative DNA helicase